MNEYIYTWIAFHGITDILLPINIWCPIYTLSLLSYFIPMNILNFITILTSTVHFTNDLYFFNCNDLYFFNYNDILLCLLLLLYFGEYKFPQYIILSYMSIIHVPIHLIKLHCMWEAGMPKIKVSIVMDGQDFSEFVKKCDDSRTHFSTINVVTFGVVTMPKDRSKKSERSQIFRALRFL